MRLFLFSVLLILGFQFPALAQDPKPPAEMDTITIITHMIRWSGLWISAGGVFFAWLILRFVDQLVAKSTFIFAEKRMLLQKLSAFFHFSVYIATIIAVVLLSFKISREVLALIGGTIAVATGFAMKDFMASLVAGVMIMLDRPFQVGDRVSFGGEYGDINAIGLRSVKLRTLDDSIVTIPNNMFMNQITTCGNYGVLDMQIMVDFHIGVDQDVHRARELIREATVTSRFIYLPKPVVVLGSQVIIDNYVAVRLRLKAYVLDTKYEKAFVSDVTLRVMEAFGENGIHPPAILHRNLPENTRLDPRELKTHTQIA